MASMPLDAKRTLNSAAERVPEHGADVRIVVYDQDVGGVHANGSTRPHPGLSTMSRTAQRAWLGVSRRRPRG